MDKRTLLDRLAGSGEERLLYARVLDKLQQAEQRNIPAHTAFLTPQEQAGVETLVNLSGGRAVFTGGYVGAERKILVCLPDWMEEDDSSELRFLRCAFRPEHGLTHRDILGSLMGLGVKRESVGDILVGEESCDLVVMDTVADFLLQNWVSAGRAPLRVTEVDGHDLHIPQAKCQEIRDTVAALRLDAVAATGFRMSRGKAAELIAAGRVEVNWKVCTKGDKLLTAGDTVSARGFGKFELAEVGGTTKKGRTSILVKRYI